MGEVQGPNHVTLNLTFPTHYGRLLPEKEKRKKEKEKKKNERKKKGKKTFFLGNFINWLLLTFLVDIHVQKKDETVAFSEYTLHSSYHPLSQPPPLCQNPSAIHEVVPFKKKKAKLEMSQIKTEILNT